MQSATELRRRHNHFVFENKTFCIDMYFLRMEVTCHLCRFSGKGAKLAIDGYLSDVFKSAGLAIDGYLSNVFKSAGHAIYGYLSNVFKFAGLAIYGYISNMFKSAGVAIDGYISNVFKSAGLAIDGYISNVFKYNQYPLLRCLDVICFNNSSN